MKKREELSFEDSLKFLIQNMEEMNLLWVRLLIGVEGNDKKLRQKERDELKILIGESINKLSSLESLTKEIYEEQILPKLLKIILDSKDILSQQYLMECIIHSFPNSYNIKCIEQILETMTKLQEGVDICSLFITLMDKFGQYFGDFDNNLDLNDIIESAKNVYPALLQNFEVIINSNINKEEGNQNNKNKISDIPLSKLLELISSFLKFSIKCSPEEQKYNSVNKILFNTILLMNKFENKINLEEYKKICEIILAPIEAYLNFVNIKEHYQLFELLDYDNKKRIAIEIINHLVKAINNKNVEKIDSIESFKKIIKYLQPLLSNNKNNEGENINDINIVKIIQEEQNIVCKLLYIITSPEPEIILEIFNQFKNIFSYGGEIRRQFSLPSLVNAIIIFCNKIIIAYQNKISDLSDNINDSKVNLNKISNSIDINKITNNEQFHKLISNIFKLLNEVIELIMQENGEMAFKLYICCSSLVNKITVEKEKFSENCLSFMKKALYLLELDNKLNKVNLLQYLSSHIINLNILSNEQKNLFINNFIKIDEQKENREEQFKIILIISKLNYNLFKDTKLISECLIKARKFADFDMMVNKNIGLYIDLINEILYFVEKSDNIIEIKKEQIEDLIELVKGHINTIKTTNEESDKNKIDKVEQYFVNTINILKKRKNHKNEKLKEFYQKINL